MALPALLPAKPVSLKAPLRGKKGILSLFPDCASPTPEGFQGVLPQARTPADGSADTLLSLPAITPRAAGVSVEADVSSVAASSAGIAKPSTARTRWRGEKKLQRQQDLSEAFRLLRSARPGEWNAELFCQIRRGFTEEGKWGAAAGLMEAVAKTSQAVLDAGSYSATSSGPMVHLSQRLPEDSWFGFQSATTAHHLRSPEAASEPPPPLVCAASGPLEVVHALRAQAAEGHPLIVSFEVTDFSDDGDVLGALESRSTSQRDLMLRTDLDHHVRRARILSTCGGSTPEGHLRASTDPYIVLAPGVKVFRGSSEQGYPFLEGKDASEVTMLVAGRSSRCPETSRRGKGEYFVKEKDVLAYMDRLHLFALAGEAVGDVSSRAGRGGGLPFLVISAHDLTVAAGQWPRHSIAAAFKTWRGLYAHMFEGVVIACGDKRTAEILDGVINADLYTAMLDGAWAPGTWHWSPSLLDLSNNPVLSRMAVSIMAGRMTGASGPAKSLAASPRKTGRQRMSVLQQQLEVNRDVLFATNLHVDEGQNKVWRRGSASRCSSPHSGCSFSPRLSAQQGGRRGSLGAAIERRTSMGAGQQAGATPQPQQHQRRNSAQLGVEGQQQVGARRASLSVNNVDTKVTEGGLSSRHQYEVAVANRLADCGVASAMAAAQKAADQRRLSHLNQLNYEEMKQVTEQANKGARAEMARVTAVAALNTVGMNVHAKQVEMEKRADEIAESMGMSEEMKVELKRQRSQGLIRSRSEVEVGEPPPNDPNQVLNDIQKLASSLAAAREARGWQLAVPSAASLSPGGGAAATRDSAVSQHGWTADKKQEKQLQKALLETMLEREEVPAPPPVEEKRGVRDPQKDLRALLGKHKKYL